jgi:hypothetical protein
MVKVSFSLDEQSWVFLGQIPEQLAFFWTL